MVQVDEGYCCVSSLLLINNKIVLKAAVMNASNCILILT